MLVLLLRGMWILFAVRVLGWRSTVSNRTFVTYLTLGALISYTAAGPVMKAVNPFGEPSVPMSFALNAGLLLLLLLPLWRLLRGRGPQRSLSVADGFLLAFALGFGFDLMGALPSLFAGLPAAPGFNLFPPGSITDPAVTTNATTMAGHGLWAALIVLAVTAARRFTRSTPLVWAVGTVVFLFCALDRPPYWKVWPFAASWQTLTLGGVLAPWLAIVALLVLSVLEKLWAKDKQTLAQITSEWLEPLQLLLKQDVAAYARLEAQYRAARRLQLARAEAERDVKMKDVVAALESEARAAARKSAAAAAGFALKDVKWKTAWREAWFWQALCWLLLALVVSFPANFNNILFNPIFGYQINVLNEYVIDTLLVAFLLWRFLTAPPRPVAPGLEAALQFGAEKQIGRAVLWLVTLGWLFTHWNVYYPFPNLFAYLVNANNYWPSWTVPQIRTFLLLTGACITSVTMRNSRAWTLAPVVDRRVSLVRNFMAALTASTLLYVSMRSGNYLSNLETFYQTYGPSFYNFSTHVGTNANKLVGWTFALLNGLYWVPLAILFGLLTRIAVEFFSDRKPGAGKKGNVLRTLRRAAAGTGAVMPALAVAAGLRTMLQFIFPHGVFAGGCTTADDCRCVPSGADDGFEPIGPMIGWPPYIFVAGGDGGDQLGGDGIPAATGDDDDPIDVDGLTKDIYDLKKQFEDLEDQLGKEMAKQLGAISDYAQNYNKAWADAMNALNNYLQDRQLLQPGMDQLMQTLKSMSDMMRTLGILDEAMPAILALGGMVEGGFAAADAEAKAAADAAARAAGAERPPFLPPNTPLPIDVQNPGTPGTRPPGLPDLPGSNDPLPPATPPTPPPPSVPPEVPPTPPPPVAPPAGPTPGTAPLPPPTPPLPPGPPPLPTLPDPVLPDLPKGPGGQMVMMGDFDYDADLVQNAQNIKRIDGVTDVVVHGDPNAVSIRQADLAPGVQDWQDMTPSQLLEELKKGGYQPGDPIRLISCSTGDPSVANNFAQRLADASGGIVSAPSDTLWLHSDGTMTIGPDARSNTGSWVRYKPGGVQ